MAQVHALPEAGGRSRRDRDATFLLLFHPVHRGRAVVDLTDLVVHTRIEQDALGGGGLAGIDVRADTDVAVALDGGLAGHDESPNAGAADGLVLTRKGGRGQRQSV